MLSPSKPRRTTEPRRPAKSRCPTAATGATATMASPTVLTFDAEGHAVDFDVWIDDLQLFLQCDSRDGVSLFDQMSCVSTAPAATADSTVRSHWTTSRYSSPATAALSRLMLPYLFPDLSVFATVADLLTHLRTSDARYRAALPTEDHFLSLCPTELTVDLLEERLTAAKKSILAVGASRGDRRAPFFEGCSHAPLLPSVASAAAVDLVGTEEVGAASAPSGRRRTSRGKGGKGGGGDGGGGGGAMEEAEGVAVEVVEAAATAGEAAAAVVEVVAAVVLVEVQPCSMEALVVASASSSRVPVRSRRPSSFVNGTLGVGGLGVLVPALRSFHRLALWGDNFAIFHLDFDAILAAMYAVTDSAESDCNLSVPPDPGIQAAALGASESAAPGTGESAALGAGESALSGTAPTEALHTFTLDLSASRSFFCDSTTLTPLSRPVAVSLGDPSGCTILARSSMVLPCPAAPSGLLSGLHLPSFSTNLVSGADLQDTWVDQFTPGGQRVTHCTCSRTGRHLATFTHRPGLSLYTLTTTSPPVAASGQVAASSQVFSAASRSSPVSTPCSCHPLAHETLLWHHRLGHPSLPRLLGMASRTLVSGLPRPLTPLPPGPAPTCVPCVEGRQRAAPHSFEFTPTEAPLWTLHMDVWGPARVRGQGHERYFLLVVDDYSHYTTVIPLCSKGEVNEEIRQTFMLLASPQQNGIAERRIGMVMDVARTSIIHAAAPHFLWPFARLFPYRTASLPPPPLFLAPGTPPINPLPPQGPAPLGVSQLDPVEPVKVALDLGAARGAEPAGVGTWGGGLGVAVYEGAEPGGAEPECVEPGGVETGGAESGSAEPGGAEPERSESGGPPGVPSQREPLSPQQLREWYTLRFRCAAGAGAARGATGAAGGASGARAVGGAAGAGAAECADGTGAAGGAAGDGVAGGSAGAGAAGATAAGGAGADGPGGARTGGTGAAGAGGASRVGAAGAGAVAPGGAAGARVVGVTEAGGAAGVSRPASPESRYASPVRAVRTGRRVPRHRPPPVPGTHSMTLRPSTAPHRSYFTRFLATAVTDPLFESTAASTLVAELVDFAASCRLDYATSLVAESASASVCPPSIGGEFALGTDVLEDRHKEFECISAAVPHLVSMLLAPEGDPDAPDISTPRSYAEPPGANIISGMWIFRVKRPSHSLPVFEARYVARGFSQQHGVDFFQTFSPTPKMTTLRWHDTLRTTLAALGFAPSTADPSLFLCTDTTLPPFYILEYVDDLVFATADTEALAHVKFELQKRHTCTDLGKLTSYLGLRIIRDRAQRTITLTQSHMVHQVLQHFGFTYSSPQSTPLPTGHSLSAPPSDESVEPSGLYPELVGCLITSGMGLVLGGRARVVLTGHADASWVDDLATQRSSQGYTFCLGSGSLSWQSTRSSSVLSSSCEAEIYAGAMAAQELRLLTYLLSDLGEAPRSPPVLYVDNKAMLALCQEHRQEHRTKHIALRYFLAQ
ncbi:unnamed protein product [Closterium sp. NIES-54]